MFTDYLARLPPFSYNGHHRYFLTFCTHNRAPLFPSPEHVQVVLEQIVRVAE